MTNFELHNDYRTKSFEALDILGLTHNDVSEANDFHELYRNLTPAKKQLVMAAIEVYRLFAYRERKDKILNSNDIYMVMKPYLQDLKNEEFWVIMLNQSNTIIKKVRVSFGGIDMTAVDIRLILKEALLCNAVSLVLVHNHPSGNTRPSTQDNTLTEKMKKAANVMNIRLLDHVVFTDNGYYSYSDEGML
ncbi:JAB domain-containing protein [Bacteroides sp. 41_26]|uniref:JAB domain-containing protein n=1 Tax=Bacteroides sp. 41_26 TaxID=1896973 RepID=UPI00259C835F|nr:JAB domain-containing protein [Bacteroides sp. 41_26]